MGSNPAAPTIDLSRASEFAGMLQGDRQMIDYQSLLDRMKAAQAELLAAAARAKTLPSDGALRKIADLEVAIGALEHLLDENVLPKA